jgi:D-aminoacyl-tRNA deacylase
MNGVSIIFNNPQPYARLMRVVIASRKDEAGMNIIDKLKRMANWKVGADFEDNPSYHSGNFVLVTTDRYHLYCDDIDIDVEKFLSIKPEVVIFASKHRSESGQSTLTVHPIGNFSKPEFGGKERELSTSCPGMMTEALRILRRKAREADLPYDVSFEVTHHGPFLNTPTFFIEIGSLEEQWRDERAGEIIAETILESGNTDYPVAIGAGGGHYAPRLTDVALARKISFGHMMANYALEKADEEMLRKGIERTPGVEMVYFHRKSMKKPDYRRLKDWFESRGIRAVREGDLDKLPGGDVSNED